MKIFILALVVFFHTASADYLKLSETSGSTTCEGTVSWVSSEYIGCQTNSSSATSFRVSCANSTSANVLTYANTDCSGTPVGSILFPSDLGCETSGPTGSFNLQCIDGEFEPPSPSANTYVYSEIYSCPATSSDVLNVVYSYQCGTCFDYGGGKYASYACNSRSVLISFYTDSSCSDGATDTYIIQYTGCAATSQGVSVTECNMGDNVTSISNGKPFVEFKALPIATATQSVRDAAHAKVENAVASALAQALN